MDIRSGVQFGRTEVLRDMMNTGLIAEGQWGGERKG